MQLQSASPVFVCVGATRHYTFATAICRKSNALTVIPLDGHCSLYKQIGDLLYSVDVAVTTLPHSYNAKQACPMLNVIFSHINF